MNDDSISRQAVLEKQYRIDDSTTLSTRDVVNVEDIEEMPSVTPTQNCVENCVENALGALDCISRQAVEAELKNCEIVNVRDENDNFIGYYNADTVDSIVRNLPSVNPQEPKTDVLDKIIAEIDENISHYEHFLSSNTANGLMIAKKIIDKYKAESEE